MVAFRLYIVGHAIVEYMCICFPSMFPLLNSPLLPFQLSLDDLLDDGAAGSADASHPVPSSPCSPDALQECHGYVHPDDADPEPSPEDRIICQVGFVVNLTYVVNPRSMLTCIRTGF